MRFAVLGRLEVEGSDGPLAITSPKVRTLLATLLFRANTEVPTGTLHQALWGYDPPSSAVASLHNHVTRLRRQLGAAEGERLVAGVAAYTFRAERAELDLLDFTCLSEAAGRAREQRDWVEVARLTDAALALWRGVPLDGLEVDLLAADVRRLVAVRQEVLTWSFEAALRLSRHGGLIPRLTDAVAEFPFAETFHVQLMEALDRGGQQAQALEVFQRLRRALVDELGIEPSAAARAAQRRILDATRSAAAAPAPDRPAPPASAPGSFLVPAQLPRDITAFTGRTAELEELVTACRVGAEQGGVIDIHAIDGMAGVGKTAFAIHAGHRLAADFPDGQIFLSLHAHTPGTAPVPPADALATLLVGLGVDPARIPADLSGRAGMWRAQLAGRRVLLLLDDARSSEQVRPLLPASPGSLVLVTSRRRLLALEDAMPFTLDVLPAPEAAALLVAKSGRPQLSPDDPSVREIVRLCGYLPLAIQLTAARLRHRRSWTVADLLPDLAETSLRLDALHMEDLSVAAAFDLSYRDLGAEQQRLFRLLGLLFGEDLDVPTAAALSGTDAPAVRALLRELVDHHLVEEPRRGRYRMHDLIREHARSLVEAEPAGDDGADGADGRDAARQRLLDYYLHTAARAGSLLGGSIPLRSPDVVHVPVACPPLAGEDDALAWLRTERANLLAAVDHAAGHSPRHAAQLPAALHEFLRSQGHWAEAGAVHRTALEAATASGDLLGMAISLLNSGAVALYVDEYSVGAGYLGRAVALFEECDHRLGLAVSLHQLGAMHRLSGQYAKAEEALMRARTLFDHADHATHLAHLFTELGHVQQLTGQFAAATRTLQSALEAHRRTGNRRGEANALGQLGDVLQWTGRYAEALANHQRALELFTRIGNVVGQAIALVQIGEVHWVLGDLLAAEHNLREALERCDRIGSRLVRANALAHLSSVRLALGDHAGVASCLGEALEICRDLGSRLGEAHVLLRLGRLALATADPAAAETHLVAAVELFEAMEDRGGEAETRNALGALGAARELPDEAARHHGRALEIASEIGAALEEARALEGLATARRLAGDDAEERLLLERCLASYTRLAIPDAGRVRARLHRSGTPSTTLDGAR
ncbi:AfsR/SARP family transcriptional regulator [Streptacidiphilus jiangxiensis]|uniref:DNA-binding transcriptional activator of the SARP family n=1 Tax=Streptacidiphilus jiangxiensis TaxID=235985 RepID=A0A1H7SA61_STRJI|nr:tetratricopeptide repeat protein [Streptacidiphilus jiangxiensis]SEL69169.1 DNA-binding transcriptional activator of the SARP family [Streptacidiphilus jiangxiensis]